MTSFSLYALPPEIQYLVLDSCPNKSLARMLRVSRRTNSLVKQIMANRLSRVCGLPTSLDDTQSTSRGQILLRAYSPGDTSHTSVNWFDTEYVETNNQTRFHYHFSSPYSSHPSTASNSDVEMNPSTPQSLSSSRCKSKQLHGYFNEDIVPQSKFTIKSHLKTSYNGMQSAGGNNLTLTPAHPLLRRQLAAQLLQHHTNPVEGSSLQSPNQVASVDIVDGDGFAQVVLQVAVTLSNSQQIPVLLFKKTQRVYAEWAQEDEYLIHNKELTCRIQVTQSDPTIRTNDFGEHFQRYEVLVQELVFNTGFLLSQLEYFIPQQSEMVRYVSSG